MTKIIKQGILIKGMTCTSCEKIIKKQAGSLDGVESIDIDYSTGKGYVEFNSSKTNIDKILDKIEEKGYEGYILETENPKEEYIASHNPKKKGYNQPKTEHNKSNWFGYTSLLLGILVVGYFLLKLSDKISLPQISPTMSYGLLFLVGLLTGFHCVAMCGGFVVSYTAKNAQEGKKSHKSHLAYGTGKLISYTIIGAAFGLLGAIITFTPTMRGFAGIIAGLFLIIFGLNMLNIFPSLRKFRIKTPGFLTKFTNKHQNSSPFVIGLLNGLMIACGPLQAIYIMAAGTGSWIEGAKLLFIFALGTLPVMLGFGYFTSFISSKMANKILRASGAIVIILGLIMINRGLALTGTGYDVGSFFASSENFVAASNNNDNIILKEGYQEIKMDVLASGWNPNKFILKKDIPVKWIIDGKELNGCNNAIQVPKLGLNFKIKPGIQTIEFTPKEEGTIPFSCWMGMKQGQFIVKDNVDLTDKESIQKELAAVQVPKSGSCGMDSGCGCGG